MFHDRNWGYVIIFSFVPQITMSSHLYDQPKYYEYLTWQHLLLLVSSYIIINWLLIHKLWVNCHTSFLLIFYIKSDQLNWSAILLFFHILVQSNTLFIPNILVYSAILIPILTSTWTTAVLPNLPPIPI